MRRTITAAVPSNEPTAIASFKLRGRSNGRSDDKLVHRAVVSDGNHFDGQAAERSGQTAACMAGNVDFARHETADADDATHHQYLEVQLLLGEKTLLLTIIEMGIAQSRAGNADVKTVRGDAGIGKEQRKYQKGETNRLLAEMHIPSFAEADTTFHRSPPNRFKAATESHEAEHSQSFFTRRATPSTDPRLLPTCCAS